MEPLEGVTCGVDGHDPECLCDVVIHEPTPINIHAVQGMWMGQEVADANGFQNWDNPTEVLDYLCAVLLLHDCYDFQKRYCQDTVTQEQIRPRADGYVTEFSIIRVTVRKAMSTRDATIGKVLWGHDLTAEQFTRAISNGHWEMDMPTLLQFEEAIVSGSPSIPTLASRFGMSERAVKNLLSYWPKNKRPVATRGVKNQPHQIRARELVKAGVRNTDVIHIIQNEFGVTLSRSAITKIRTRMK